ncbi:MAG: MATE family efflux transporter [Clostridiales bacterium]|nr:MATE family efflux transporter [Clostridiales bacterium]
MSSSKGLYKRVIQLMIPIALQNVITYLVGFTDNYMVGVLGDRPLAGTYAASQLQNILQMLVIGLGAAITILASQYWGKKDTESIKSITVLALKFSVGAGLVFFIASLFFPAQILGIFTNDQGVLNEGLKFTYVIRYTYVFFCITQVLISSMRSVERVKIGMNITIITFFVNLFFNWVFIYGHLGAPALGVAGSAISTLIARIIETIIMVVYVRFIDDRLLLRFKDLFKSNAVFVKDFFKYGSPVILGDILWGINLAVQGLIIGRLGETAMASVSITNNVFSIMGVAVYGTAGASAIIIGKTVGSGDYERVKEYAKKLQILFLIMGIISGSALFALKGLILHFYNLSGNLSADTITMATQFLIVLSITMVGTSYQMSTLTGIVRAGGAIYFVLVNDFIFVWFIVIPSALIAQTVFHASPLIVFACLKSDQILKCAVAVVKVNRFNWIKKLTREPAKTVSA